jgi:hypothetical protein
MSDVYEHNPGDHEDPVAGSTWTIGIIGVIFLIFCVLLVTVLFRAMFDAQTAESVVNATPQQQAALRQSQVDRLTDGPHYEIREADGRRHLVVPLEQAMGAYLQSQQQAE